MSRKKTFAARQDRQQASVNTNWTTAIDRDRESQG